MDESKRTKILLGVLALMAVACGTYYFAFRSSGKVAVAQKETASAPKPREVAPVESNKPRERVQQDQLAGDQEGDRGPKAREMGMDEIDEQLKKERESTETVKKKKKKPKPAA